jgi:transcriptional regulator with XRE-family HTH domain
MMMMSISEQIKVLCVRANISAAELARRMGQSPQNFNAKLKRESFTVSELEQMADAVNARFERNFILFNGDTVKGE